MHKPIPFKVKELSTVLDISAPAVTKRLKPVEEALLKTESNRTFGIPRDVVAKVFADAGYSYFYRKNVFMFHTIVGGSAKTSACWSLFNAFLRISPKANPTIIVSTDSQGSIDHIATGKISEPENQKVLVDYFDGHATIQEILLPLDESENLWIIPSNLNNVFLDKALGSPQKMKNEASRLIDDIYRRFPGTNPSLFIDTMPALSASTGSFVVAMSRLLTDYGRDNVNAVVSIPLRSDSTSLNGATIAVKEMKTILETFNLPDCPTLKVFLANYDKRMSLSGEILKRLFSSEVLADYVCDTVIRTSSEVAKTSDLQQSIFSSNLPPVAQDYSELLLEILGFQKKAGLA